MGPTQDAYGGHPWRWRPAHRPVFSQDETNPPCPPFRSPDRGLAVLSTGAVGVAGLDDEAGSHEGSLGVDVEIRGPTEQIAWHQELHIVASYPLVRVEVLAPSVGVDRHLSRLPSADRCDEVEGDETALFAGQIHCVIADVYLHRYHHRTVHCFS